MEEEEDDEAEMLRPAMQVHNRRVTKRCQFTLYEEICREKHSMEYRNHLEK